MKSHKSTRVVLTFLFVALLSGIGVSRGTSPASPRTGKIKGVVLDVNKARVVNAIVKVRGSEIERQVISDDEGRFEIIVPPGDYQISVRANGFRPFTSPLVRVELRKSQVVNVHLVGETPRGLTPALGTS